MFRTKCTYLPLKRIELNKVLRERISAGNGVRFHRRRAGTWLSALIARLRLGHAGIAGEDEEDARRRRMAPAGHILGHGERANGGGLLQVGGRGRAGGRHSARVRRQQLPSTRDHSAVQRVLERECPAATGRPLRRAVRPHALPLAVHARRQGLRRMHQEPVPQLQIVRFSASRTLAEQRRWVSPNRRGTSFYLS